MVKLGIFLSLVSVFSDPSRSAGAGAGGDLGLPRQLRGDHAGDLGSAYGAFDGRVFDQVEGGQGLRSGQMGSERSE